MTNQEPFGGLLDVHVHFVAPWWADEDGTSGAQGHELINSVEAVTGDIESGQAGTRVLSAPVEILYGTTAKTADSQIRKHNEYFAELAREHPGVKGFGSVDAFSGDAGGQVAQAIDELGLAGIALDSGRHDVVLGNKRTWPTFEAAAERNVPVFVHPVWTADQEALRGQISPSASGWGRGYQNGLALLAVANSGLVQEFPTLRVVFTSLGVGSLWFVHQQLESLADDLGERPHLYFDTTSFHAPSLRYQIDVLGVDRVVVGSDWPFHQDGTKPVAESTLTSIGLDEAERAQVSYANLAELIR